MLGNKEVMGSNIRHWMDKKGVNSTDVCNDLGFKKSSFSEWINGKTYPRIDKIEMMARYFQCNKSDLIEYRNATTEESDLILLNYIMKEIPDHEMRQRVIHYAQKVVELCKAENID